MGCRRDAGSRAGPKVVLERLRKRRMGTEDSLYVHKYPEVETQE